MSAEVLILPVVRVERHSSDDDVLLRLVVSRATARVLQKVAHERWDGDMARYTAELLRHFAEIVGPDGPS